MTMNPDSKILDDIARVAGGAVNVVSGLRQQIRDEVRTRFEELAARMDLVPREDFEQVEDMVKKLRLEQEELIKRMDALEGNGRNSAKKNSKK